MKQTTLEQSFKKLNKIQNEDQPAPALQILNIIEIQDKYNKEQNSQKVVRKAQKMGRKPKKIHHKTLQALERRRLKALQEQQATKNKIDNKIVQQVNIKDESKMKITINLQNNPQIAVVQKKKRGRKKKIIDKPPIIPQKKNIQTNKNLNSKLKDYPKFKKYYDSIFMENQEELLHVPLIFDISKTEKYKQLLELVKKSQIKINN